MGAISAYGVFARRVFIDYNKVKQSEREFFKCDKNDGGQCCDKLDKYLATKNDAIASNATEVLDNLCFFGVLHALTWPISIPLTEMYAYLKDIDRKAQLKEPHLISYRYGDEDL